MNKQHARAINSKRFAQRLHKKIQGNGQWQIAQIEYAETALCELNKSIQFDYITKEQLSGLNALLSYKKMCLAKTNKDFVTGCGTLQTESIATVETTNHTSEFINTNVAQNVQSLLQNQKDLTAKDLEVEQKTKSALMEELSELTSLLKESTFDMNKSIVYQNTQLSHIQRYASENRDELNSQKLKINKSTTVMQTSIWSTIWIIAGVIVAFFLTILVIKLFPYNGFQVTNRYS